MTIHEILMNILSEKKQLKNYFLIGKKYAVCIEAAALFIQAPNAPTMRWLYDTEDEKEKRDELIHKYNYEVEQISSQNLIVLKKLISEGKAFEITPEEKELCKLLRSAFQFREVLIKE